MHFFHFSLYFIIWISNFAASWVGSQQSTSGIEFIVNLSKTIIKKKSESLKPDYHMERIYYAIILFSIGIFFVCMRNGNGTLQSE